MDRGNKLWEGHRMVLPEMRERILENSKAPKPLTRQWTEEALEQLERKLKYAQCFQKPLLVIYLRDDQVEECITFTFRLGPGVLECDLASGRRKKIQCNDIIEVSLL
ncbi:MAG: YolD-like family protein [Carboxydocellales bacterium]